MLQPVAEKISQIEGVDDLDVYSFKDSLGKKSTEVKRAVKGAKMVTHSAGMLAVDRPRLPPY